MSKPKRPKYKEKFLEEQSKNNTLENNLKNVEEKKQNLEEKNQFLSDKIIALLEEGKKSWWDKYGLPLTVLFNLLLAGFVAYFSFVQTDAIKTQTKILAHQDLLFSTQNKLFVEQNSLVVAQNCLMENQNGLLIFQNDNLVQQNTLFKNQNDKIDIQTNLSEAERRGSLVFLMNNIFDRIDDELKDSNNIDRNLSSQLIGRISGLSFSLKPYKYLVNDKLLDHFVSPERGQLLHNLTSSQLSDSTMEQINRFANFSFSELSGVRLIDKNISGINLRNSDLRGADVSNSCLLNSNLMWANLRGITALRANFAHSIMSNTDLRNGSFSLSVLNGAILYNADLRGADFLNCIVGEKNWIHNLKRYNVKGYDEIEENYYVEPELLKNGMTIYVLKGKNEESNIDWDSIFPTCNFIIVEN